jgi:hypothetical protein
MAAARARANVRWHGAGEGRTLAANRPSGHGLQGNETALSCSVTFSSLSSRARPRDAHAGLAWRCKWSAVSLSCNVPAQPVFRALPFVLEFGWPASPLKIVF